MFKLSKINHANRKTLAVAVIFILAISAVYVVVHPRGISIKKCQSIEKQAQQLISKGGIKQANNLLKSYAKDCSDFSKIPKNKRQGSPKSLQVFSFDTTYARTAYSSGDKKSAYQYANQALDIMNNDLSSSQRKDQFSDFFTLIFIKQNSSP